MFRRAAVTLAAFAVLAACGAANAQSLNLRPIIGILSQPVNETAGAASRAYLPASYVKWMESAGARVAPIPYDADEPTLRSLFSSINGIIFTGGGQSLDFNTTYYQTARLLYNLALQANDAGDFFPIHGTCMGFQLLSILTANDHSVLDDGIFDSENLPLPLILSSTALKSRVLGQAPQQVVGTWTQTPATINLHVSGVTPTTYASNNALSTFYNVISTNQDRKGQWFVSTVESWKYPITATQWHPERNQFEWDIQESVEHTPDAIYSMQYLSDFFVNQARRSQHSFPGKEAEDAALIYNYAPTFTGNDPSQHYPDRQIYYFAPFAKHQRAGV